MWAVELISRGARKTNWGTFYLPAIPGAAFGSLFTCPQHRRCTYTLSASLYSCGSWCFRQIIRCLCAVTGVVCQWQRHGIEPSTRRWNNVILYIAKVHGIQIYAHRIFSLIFLVLMKKSSSILKLSSRLPNVIYEYGHSSTHTSTPPPLHLAGALGRVFPQHSAR